jgi:hypothetical protein
MPEEFSRDAALKGLLKTPSKPFTPKKDRPRATPKPHKQGIQRHQGR